MDLIDELLELEHGLSAADLDLYRSTCREDCVFIMPGMVADKAAALAGLAEAGPWDRFELRQPAVRQLGSGAAVLCYRFEGSRGTTRYVADMASAYVRHANGWQLVVHQQTPVEG